MPKVQLPRTECGSYPNNETTTTSVDKYVVPCRDVGRYVSIKRSGGEELHLMTLCEVIIMGFVYYDPNPISDCKCIAI